MPSSDPMTPGSIARMAHAMGVRRVHRARKQAETRLLQTHDQRRASGKRPVTKESATTVRSATVQLATYNIPRTKSLICNKQRKDLAGNQCRKLPDARYFISTPPVMVQGFSRIC